jgi:hypothetical protein
MAAGGHLNPKVRDGKGLGYISFQIAPLCDYTLLLATAKVFETFLEAILSTPFQLCLRILMMPVASQKRRPFNAEFSRRNT